MKLLSLALVGVLFLTGCNGQLSMILNQGGLKKIGADVQPSPKPSSSPSGSPSNPPDTTAPTVSLTAPAANASVSGASVTVSANASDAGSGIASVQFQIDGANLGSADTTSPYSVSLDTTAYTNGSHVLRAIAKDVAGNSKTSATRTISVNNVGPSPTPSASVSPDELYPHRPASFTHSNDLDFSQTPPGMPDDRDRPIEGTDWFQIFHFSGPVEDPIANWSQSSGVWRGHWAPGAYGGGVIGQGGGHGIGNVFTYGPNYEFLSNSPTRLYMSLRVYFDFDASQWHPISNKFVNIAGDHSQILMQLREGDNWRHAEELGAEGYKSFWVDDGDTAGQVDNPSVPTKKWVQLELLIDIPNHVYKIWQDGVLTTNATPTFSSTSMNTIGVNAFRGGGGETLTEDLYYMYDHFHIAW
jgi:hypothetical protein